uniref:Chemosensory protein 06 n=1 Tax=Chrysomela lapponica TaxID=153811 RepID=A0A310SCT9_CHRLA
MYNFSLFIFVFLIAFAIGEKYTTKYDNIDLDEILKSERLLKNYIDCLMDRGNCTPDGKELKNTLPDAMKTECSKCSDKQKEGSRKVIRFLLKNKRANFDELATKYDPDGSYIKKYKDELAKEGIMV